MLERKVNVIEELNRTLAGMDEQEKSYLMGFLEGFAAMAGIGSVQTGGESVGQRVRA